MCTICDHDDKTACYCPRCPISSVPNAEPCSVCATVNCTDAYCAGVEHFEQAGNLFCQICVEAKHGFQFQHWQLGMYCPEHKDAHQGNRTGYWA